MPAVTLRIVSAQSSSYLLNSVNFNLYFFTFKELSKTGKILFVHVSTEPHLNKIYLLLKLLSTFIWQYLKITPRQGNSIDLVKYFGKQVSHTELNITVMQF